MNLARRSLDFGLIYQVREQLKSPRPLSDLRGFEWYYLANLCDQKLIRLIGHQNAVICLALHPDGNQVVSGGADGTVRVWDLSSRRELHRFTSKGGAIHAVAVSRDRRWLAAGDANGGLRLWDLGTLQERDLVGHQSGIRSVAFSPDDRHMLSCDAAGMIVEWNTATGARAFPPLRHSHEQAGVVATAGRTNGPELMRGVMAAYAPDGRSIVSAGMDQWVMIWDIATRGLRDQVRAGTNIYGFWIKPDGREIALAEQLPGIEILDLEKPHAPRRSLQAGTTRVTAVAFSPAQPTIAMAGYGPAGLLDAQNGQILDLFEQVNNSPFSLAFAAGGQMLAMAVGDQVHVVKVTRSLHGETVAARLGLIRRLAVSRDERLLALGCENGSVVVWDVGAKQVRHTLRGHGLAVFGMAFLEGPDGVRLVTVGGDGLVQIWDTEAGGDPLRTLKGHEGAVYAVAVRPDGRQIATGGGDGVVRTWDPATGRADLPPLEHGALDFDPGL